MTKRKVLVWADSPTSATGFAQVSRNILKELHKSGKYEIDMIGINFTGEYEKERFEKEFPFLNKLVPAQKMDNPDLYGREYVIKTLAGYNKYLNPPYDIFFSIQDHFIIQQKDSMSAKGMGQAIKAMQQNTLRAKEFKKNHFLWVGYFPVDSELKQHWVDEAIATCDYPVAYCEYGVEKILEKNPTLKDKLGMIYHGTNTQDFYPLDNKKELREKYFKGVPQDAIIVINVARNQPRKDLFRTLVVFKELKKHKPDAVLYMHCDPNDMAGGNLIEMANSINLDSTSIRFLKGFNANQGITLKQLNELYNCADLFLTTTMGEGWGLPITEAMACKVPVYAPNITSIQDIANTVNGFDPETARCITFKAGNTPSLWMNFGNKDNENARPLTNVEDAVSQILWGLSHKEEVDQIVQRGYEFVQQHTWDIEVKKWLKIFDEACEVNDKLRSDDFKIEKLNRNDMCPLCNIKVKKCQHKDIYL